MQRIIDPVRQGRYGTLFLELVVVVLGILLALGFDQWRQEREEAVLETEYLLALQADLKEDLRVFDERIFPEIEMRLKVSAHLRSFTPENVPETLQEQRAFVDSISMAGYMNTFNPRRIAMDDMLATGNLRLISNKQLRFTLLEYYDSIEKWQPYDDWARKLIWENFRNEFTGFIPLDAVHMSAEGRSATPRDSFVEIVNNETFQRGLLNVRFMAGWQQQRYEAIYEEANELVNAIEEEIPTS